MEQFAETGKIRRAGSFCAMKDPFDWPVAVQMYPFVMWLVVFYVYYMSIV